MPEQVARLLGGCDRRTHTGCRDFAVLTVLARLGLRANEVATLRVEDVDRGARATIFGRYRPLRGPENIFTPNGCARCTCAPSSARVSAAQHQRYVASSTSGAEHADDRTGGR